MALDRARLRQAVKSSILGMGAFAHLPRRSRIKLGVAAALASAGLGLLLVVAIAGLDLGDGAALGFIAVFLALFFFAYDVALAYVLLERRDREGELAAAARIQQVLLASELPAHPHWSAAAHHDAAGGVGGDYHDVLALPGDRWLLVVADVSGKGIPAAILMAGLRTRLRTLCETSTDPAELAARLNHGMVIDTRPSEFATVFLALADSRQQTLTWVDAGHQPGLLVHADGSLTRLDGDSLPVGMFAEARYTGRSVTVAPGDRLVLFTDGVVEAAIGQDRELTPEEVGQAIAAHPDQSAAGAVAAVRGLVARATGGQAAADDLTILAVRF
jgi:sigma-B regulation protein RsbU (phosphoserine phosphatase)